MKKTHTIDLKVRRTAKARGMIPLLTGLIIINTEKCPSGMTYQYL